MHQLIELGFISKAFGIKGGLGYKLFSADSETIKPGISLVLRQKNKERVVVVKEVMSDGRLFLEGLTDRNEAETLKGATILIERDLLPPLPDDEFYLSDMLGAVVKLQDGTTAGELVGFSSNGAQTLLEVKTTKGHVASIPLVKALVTSVDSQKKEIIIDPPEGLLDA